MLFCHAPQRPRIRPAWRADAGRRANGVGHGLERACVALAPSRMFGWGAPRSRQRAGGATTEVRVTFPACAVRATLAPGPVGHRLPHAGFGLAVARPRGHASARLPPNLTRSPVVVCPLSRVHARLAIRGAVVHAPLEVPLPHWSTIGRDTCAGQAFPPVGPHLGCQAGWTSRWRCRRGGDFYRPDPHPKPVHAVQRGAALAWMTPSQSLPAVVAVAERGCSRSVYAPPWWLAWCGPRPRRAAKGWGGSRCCRVVRGGWARQCAPQRPLGHSSFRQRARQGGPCPLDLISVGGTHVALRQCMSAPTPPLTGEKGSLCSLHLYPALAAAKAVGASRDARPPGGLAPLVCATPPAVQGDTRRTRAGTSGPPRGPVASRARRRLGGGGVGYAGGVARRCGFRRDTVVESGRVRARHATPARAACPPPSPGSVDEERRLDAAHPIPVAVARWWGPVRLRLCGGGRRPPPHTSRRGA